MNRLFYIFLIAVAIGSCRKSFVNGRTPSDSADSAQVFSSAAGVRAYLNGIYHNLHSYWHNSDNTAGGTDDAAGISSVILAREARGTDAFVHYGLFFNNDYRFLARDANNRRVYFVWDFFYELINQTNILIEGTTNSSAITDADKTALIAEARALRAWFYFELIREFQFNIGRNDQAPGIPVYTTPWVAGRAISPKGRGTIRQTFDQIEADIQFAVANLANLPARTVKSQVDVSVALGLAARVYLDEGKWAEAATAAQSALAYGYGLDSAAYPRGFRDENSQELMWSLPQSTQGDQSQNYATTSSFLVETGDSYGSVEMDPDFVGSFTATDVRNTFYYVNDLMEIHTNKFGVQNSFSETVHFMNGRDGLNKSVDVEEPIILMRAAEMYLIGAEALARQGDDNGARNILTALQQDRDPKAAPATASGSELLEEILFERRKEFYGEMGVSFLDAKRVGEDITHYNELAGFTVVVIQPGDPVLNLQIPAQEIQANPQIGPQNQNP